MKLNSTNLDNIIGGATISGTLINAFTNIIKVLLDAAEGVGSSIRRIKDDNICPLK